MAKISMSDISPELTPEELQELEKELFNVS